MIFSVSVRRNKNITIIYSNKTKNKTNFKLIWGNEKVYNYNGNQEKPHSVYL